MLSLFTGPWRAPLIALLVALAMPARAALPAATADGQPLPSLAPMLREVSPAVVNIATYTEVRQYVNPLLNDPFFRFFFDAPRQAPQARPQRRTQSAGSGVIIDAKNGYILTNAHVVDRASEIEVGLVDGRTLKATRVGSDRHVDIAVLKVAPEKLAEIRIGSSDALQVGDFVVAIGNPFGLGQTVTSGIVSALGRSGLGIEGLEDFIQTDASINPGNSGGALVNLRGELVGINTAIIAPGGGNIGIGFAIPSALAVQIMAQLVENGEVRRGALGVTSQDLTAELAEAFGLGETQGVLLTAVDRDGAAARAGLRAGDLVVAVDGKPVRRGNDLRNRVGLAPLGASLVLDYVRDGKRATATVTLVATPWREQAGAELGRWLEGARLREVTVADSVNAAGVHVVAVADASAASRAGLREGDQIVAANRVAVRTLDELKGAVARSERQLLLQVRRGNANLFLALR